MIKEKKLGTYVLCVIEAERDQANIEYQKYFEMYPPQGYSTHMLQVEDVGTDRRFTIERRASCD